MKRIDILIKGLFLLLAVSSFSTAYTQLNVGENREIKIYSSQKAKRDMLIQQKSMKLIPDIETEIQLINVYPQVKYQEILGFGGAFTETSAYNFAQVSDTIKRNIAEAYFDKEKGLGVNFCRAHINSSDFSLAEYTYVTGNDKELKTFSIDNDRKYIIPFIKAAQKYSNDLLLFASPWSPPGWMKDNKSMVQGGKLLPEHYDTWARYITKYFEEYRKEGINFFGLTVQNEAKAVQTWESCTYTGTDEAVFATKNLRPALNKAGFSNLKIMIWDHNKERVLDRALESFAVKGATDDIWGIAFHWYSGEHFDALRMTHEMFPDKPLILTEFCRGGSSSNSSEVSVPYSDWTDVEAYANEMIGDFNNYMAAATDWNMIVDLKGGPYHNRDSGVKAQIVVDKENNTFTLGNIYYAVGHFSKFVKRGAKRIGSSSYNDFLRVTAFQNPSGEVVVIVLNKAERVFSPKLRIYDCTAGLDIPAKSLTTLIIPAK